MQSQEHVIVVVVASVIVIVVVLAITKCMRVVDLTATALTIRVSLEVAVVAETAHQAITETGVIENSIILSDNDSVI